MAEEEEVVLRGMSSAAFNGLRGVIVQGAQVAHGRVAVRLADGGRVVAVPRESAVPDGPRDDGAVGFSGGYGGAGARGPAAEPRARPAEVVLRRMANAAWNGRRGVLVEGADVAQGRVAVRLADGGNVVAVPEANASVVLAQYGKGGADRHGTLVFGATLYCKCDAWRFQHIPADERVCKHVTEYMEVHGLSPHEAGLNLDGSAEHNAGSTSAKRKAEQDAGSAPRKKPREATQSPGCMLASDWWKQGLSISEGFHMSEKLDGIRAIWTGREILSRSGKSIPGVPESVVAELRKAAADTSLDGELYIGPKKFNATQSVVMSGTGSRQGVWEAHGVAFHVFDSPGPGGFEERFNRVTDRVAEVGSSLVRIHPHRRVDKADDLEAEYKRVVAKGGEGLMLRAWNSPYDSGPTKSKNLLKMKPLEDDEATVIGHNPGKGKNAGGTGSLRMELDNG